jgi:phenylacetate-CoA ligase
MTDINQKLRDIVQHAYANAPATRARFEAAGLTPDDIQTVADLPKLPVLPKDQVVTLQRENPPFGGLLAVPQEQIRRVFFSPGPIYEPAPPPDDSAWDVMVTALKMIGFRAGDVVLNTFSYHLVPAGYIFDEALTRLGCTVIPGGVGNSDLQLQMLRDLQCTGYAGTPSFLMSLIRKAEEAGMDFRAQFRVQKAITSAEPLPPSLRASLADYGITVGNAYATAELGVLALNLDDTPDLHLLDEPIVEVVSPDSGQPVGPGEAGEIVVTNFNPAYPLIRLGTGDMAVNVDPKPGESKQSERAVRLVGRSGDAVKVRGMFVHPNQLRMAARQVAGVARVQGVVTRPDLSDVFTLRVVADAGVDETAVSQALMDAVRGVCRVRVNGVEFVDALADDAPGMIDGRSWD